MQTQTPNTPPTERVFDENGMDVAPEAAAAVPPEPEAEPPETPEAPATPPAPAAPKFRIGDKEFGTQAEAIAYAEETARSANAQQQWMQQIQQPPAAPQPSVTPPTPQTQVPEEFFTNPQAYLQKFGQDVYNRTLAEFQRMQAAQNQADQIWGEFSSRHPELADFRADVEAFTQNNIAEVKGIISAKGRAAGLDYIATKLKSGWEQRADAIKARRELPNSSPRTASPSQRSAPVTPEPTVKKPATFADQINSIRKRRRTSAQ